jgi:hypothetical protein
MIFDPVFIVLSFDEDCGKYLMMPFFKPNKLNCVISVVAESIVVAIPIWSGRNNRAFIIQKTKPNMAVMSVLAIR